MTITHLGTAPDDTSIVVQQSVPAVKDALKRYGEILASNPTMPICDILPLIFKLKGKPYTVTKTHFPQEPMYRITGLVPSQQVTKAGRQVAKSTALASSGILRATMIPYYNHLTVTPLFEQVRKFSSNYVKPFLIESTVRTLITKPGTDNSVLQRTLANGSSLFYNYATNDPNRIRGTSADELNLDELQDFDLSILGVIESCLDASPYKIRRYSGTPKTFDGPLQVYWERSSQGVWHIPCHNCYKVNRCDTRGQLLKMVDNATTLVCGFCGKPVDSAGGYYVHDVPERRLTFPGYHLPQVIFPMHYADPLAWDKIQSSIREQPKFYFYNEILGESIDVGLKMLTQEELARAATVEPVEPSGFKSQDYYASAMGVDWGGKGREMAADKEEFISNTAMALGGIRPDGIIEIKYLYRTPYSADLAQESAIVYDAFSKSGVNWFAHDFTGAGYTREVMMVQQGVPARTLVPFTYAFMSMNKKIVEYNKPGPAGSRNSWTLDKSRSLRLLCELIRTRQVLLPSWEKSKHMLTDFFSLFEESKDSARAGQTILVKRLLRHTDDIVHAINFVVMGLYKSTNKWPNLAKAFEKLEGEPETWTHRDA
jgi:hypothetical protein